MKKYLLLLILPILFNCSGDDQTVVIEDKGKVEVYNTILHIDSEPKPDDQKYNNFISSYVRNTTKTDVSGYVVFEIKSYGNIVTSELNIPPGKEISFNLALETWEIIDESYLIKAEFVRE